MKSSMIPQTFKLQIYFWYGCYSHFKKPGPVQPGGGGRRGIRGWSRRGKFLEPITHLALIMVYKKQNSIKCHNVMAMELPKKFPISNRVEQEKKCTEQNQPLTAAHKDSHYPSSISM